MSAMESTPNTPDLSTVADLSDAPIPTARTLGMRRNIPYQFRALRRHESEDPADGQEGALIAVPGC